MQYVRFSVNEEPVQYGQVIGDSVFVLDQNFLDHPVRTDCSYPLSEDVYKRQLNARETAAEKGDVYLVKGMRGQTL